VPESSFLETTAEVSVAFAGFIGIFLILATRDGRFPAVDSVTIRSIVVCSSCPVFYSALPLMLFGLGLSGSTLWRISSALTGLAGVASTVYFAFQLRAVPPAERPRPAELRNFYAWFLTVSSLGCHIANTLAWPWAPSGGVYTIGVWAIVAIAGGNFIILIFRRVL
jgi:hypothetical protein